MRRFIAALTFLTRIPVPFKQDFTQTEFSRSQTYYPLVGLLLGALLLLLWHAGAFFFPSLVLAALVIGAEIGLTGGLHLDGYMDSMDGLFSARKPERMLEIMKDSRIGAHGAIGLTALLLIKFSLLASLKEKALPLLLLYPALGRWSMLWGMLRYPYVRDDGLGKGFHEAARWPVFLLQGLVLLLLAYVLLRGGGVAAWAGAIGASVCFAWRTARLFGGLTGDLYGAMVEISQVGVLLLAYPFLR